MLHHHLVMSNSLRAILIIFVVYCVVAPAAVGYSLGHSSLRRRSKVHDVHHVTTVDLRSTPPSTSVVDKSHRDVEINHHQHQVQPRLPQFLASATATLALILATTSQPVLAAATTTTTSSSTTAARIHLNSLPPSTVSVQIGDLPIIGPLLSGTYSKVDDESLALSAILKGTKDSTATSSSSAAAPIVIQSPTDKGKAIQKIATTGHLEFDVDGPIVQTHLNVDVAASEPGVATIRVDSPLIPRLPFRNSASNLVPPAAMTLKKNRQNNSNKVTATTVTSVDSSSSSSSAAHISLNSLPPAAILVDIQDLPVLGKVLSGVYTKMDAKEEEGVLTKAPGTASTAAVTIESPLDKVSAIKAIASRGHLEFDVDGLLNTHLDVDIATDTAGVATIRVASPIIPALPFRNAASF